MLKSSKCEPQTQNIYDAKGPICRPHRFTRRPKNLYNLRPENYELEGNSKNLRTWNPSFFSKKTLLTAPKVESPYKKYESENLKKIILEAQKSITFKTKTRWTLEQQNQLTMRSKNLDALNGTLPKVYEQKNINLEIQTSRNLRQKKSETSNSNK